MKLRRRLLATAVLAPAVAGLCIAGLQADRLDGVQAQWEDLGQPGLGDSTDVAVVAIDRATLTAVGEGWPWPRSQHADLLRAVGAARPAAIVYDVLFADPGEGDDDLATALADVPTVLGAALILDPQDGGPPTFEVKTAQAPTEQFLDVAGDLGHLNVTNSADQGVVRSLPLYALDERGIAFPSVALSAVAMAERLPGVLTERPGGLQVGSRFIPLDDGELRLNWSASLEQGDVIPALDLLDGIVDPAALAGRIVIVGVTEPTLGDQHLVPVDRSGGTSGVMILANAANTIASNGYVVPASRTREIVLVAVCALLVTIAFQWLRLTLAAAVAIALLAALAVFTTWRFHAAGVTWNVVWPALAVTVGAAAGTAWRYWTETRHRRQAWRLFSTYVPASVVAQMEDPRRLAEVVRGTRVEVSVLFCDLRGFTPVAATLDPPLVRALLDHYYDYAVTTIHDHGGTVMQFVGDEVFAVFGAPLPTPDAGEQAVRCALALQGDIARLDARLAADELPPIRYGISVHRGPVVAAHVGTSSRRQYSVVGDTVNVGSRLCAQAGAGEVVASTEARRPAEAWCAATLCDDGPVTLKGVAAPVPIFRARLGQQEGIRTAAPTDEMVSPS